MTQHIPTGNTVSVLERPVIEMSWNNLSGHYSVRNTAGRPMRIKVSEKRLSDIWFDCSGLPVFMVTHDMPETLTEFWVYVGYLSNKSDREQFCLELARVCEFV